MKWILLCFIYIMYNSEDNPCLTQVVYYYDEMMNPSQLILSVTSPIGCGEASEQLTHTHHSTLHYTLIQRRNKMRRRITFIQPPNAPFSPDQAVLTPDALTITNLDAVREERLTVSYDELPDDVLVHHNTIINAWIKLIEDRYEPS